MWSRTVYLNKTWMDRRKIKIQLRSPSELNIFPQWECCRHRCSTARTHTYTHTRVCSFPHSSAHFLIYCRASTKSTRSKLNAHRAFWREALMRMHNSGYANSFIRKMTNAVWNSATWQNSLHGPQAHASGASERWRQQCQMSRCWRLARNI